MHPQRVVKVIVATLTALLVTACATGHPFKMEAPSGDNRALIYVYRPAKFLSAGETPDIFINGKKALALVNGGYSLLRLAPGRYQVEIKKPSGPFAFMVSDLSSKVEFNVERSSSYYVRWTPELLDSSFIFVPVGSGTVLGSFRREGNMTLVNEQTALSELPNCNYLEPVSIQIDPVGE